jgi:hypothetical protein
MFVTADACSGCDVCAVAESAKKGRRKNEEGRSLKWKVRIKKDELRRTLRSKRRKL